MSSPIDHRGSSRRRNAWGHWVPLFVTVTVATVGVAAWIWSQRKDNNQDDAEPIEHDLDYENADYGDNPAYGAAGDTPRDGPGPRPPSHSDGQPRPAAAAGPDSTSAPGWGAQMTGALRRTPSPQQVFDSARKSVVAGVSAAGVAVGSALAAIREEDKTAYADHETWSEEADAKAERSPAAVAPASQPPPNKEANKRRKKVAIIVSAANNHVDDLDEDDFHEHAVCLFLPDGMAVAIENDLIADTSPRSRQSSLTSRATSILLPRGSISSSTRPASRRPRPSSPRPTSRPPPSARPSPTSTTRSRTPRRTSPRAQCKS